MGYREVMDLPMRVFWELSGQVDRIRADEARINLQVGTALQSPDGAQSMSKWFDKVAPGPFKLSLESKAEPDPDAFDQLRSLASM